MHSKIAASHQLWRSTAMIRVSRALVLFLGLAVGASAQTPPVVRIIAVSPEPADRLAGGQNLNVRLAYESDRPLRFQAAGYRGGQKHESLATNPSPAYPAGKGEAIVWVFGQPGARIDEIRVHVYEADWHQISELPVPVQAAWRAGVPSAPAAPWVAELSSAQQRAVSQAMRQEPQPTSFLDKIWFGLVVVLLPVAFLTVPGYPILQLFTLWKLRGPARLLSALPLAFMLPVYAFCLYAFLQKSNLWPLYAIFASPVAFIFTLVVFLIARRRERTAAL
jgi:hypothetical protein